MEERLMSKYKITIRIKTAQSAANPKPNTPQEVFSNPEEYANSFVDQNTGQRIYLEKDLQTTTQGNLPQLPKRVQRFPSETYDQISELRKNNLNRDLLNTPASNQYTQLVKNPSAATPTMNPIRQQALQDQRQVRQQALQGPQNQQKQRTYNYNQANNALYKALDNLGMQNYNAISLQANQEIIQQEINDFYLSNPRLKQLALDLLNQKIKAAGTQ